MSILPKFKFKHIGTVINSPKEWQRYFLDLGFNNSFNQNQKSENTLVFVYNRKEFVNFLGNELIHIESDSVLWFAYPKGTSNIKTDINRDILRITGEDFLITTVTAISLDDTWSALRFRPIDQVGEK